MNTNTRFVDIFSRSKIIAHLSTPLYRNGYALVASTGATSLLGVIFWMLATRNYPTEVVGLNSAMITSMMFLANLSQFQFVNALNRFLPKAGNATGRIILFAYVVSLCAALVTSLVFINGITFWFPTLGVLRSSPYFIFWFTFSTMIWVIFVIQDGALVGLRQAIWIPIKNIFYAVAKILFLVTFASLLPQYGIFTSWTIPMIFLLIPMNLLIFRRLVPSHIETTKENADCFSIYQISKFVSIDYFSSMIWLGTISLLPLIVIRFAGVAANAYFSLSWLIAYMLYLVSSNMGMSLITEAAIDQSKLTSLYYSLLIQTARIIIPGVIVIVLFAPIILRIFGKEYSTEGTELLRLLTLSAVPYVITSLFISIARVQFRIITIVKVIGTLCLMVLSLSHILLGLYGIKGVGIAWLVSQTVMATILLLTQLRMTLIANMNLNFLLRTSTILRYLWWKVSNYRKIIQANALYQELLPTLDSLESTSSPEEWKALNICHTLSDMIVVTIGPSGGDGTIILNLPQSRSAKMCSQRQISVIETLHADDRLGEWRNLLPQIVAVGEIGEQAYRIEKMIPGVTALKLLSMPVSREVIQTTAISSIVDMHLRTATINVFDERLYENWVSEPLEFISKVERTFLPFDSCKDILERVDSELRATFLGCSFTLSWIHGDYWPGNILMTGNGRSVTGIVDWETARPDGFPILDLMNFLISTRMIVERKELGEVIQNLLHRNDWSQHERELLDASGSSLYGDQIEMRELLQLFWLGHVGSNLKKSKRFAHNQVWIAKNIKAVLETL